MPADASIVEGVPVAQRFAPGLLTVSRKVPVGQENVVALSADTEVAIGPTTDAVRVTVPPKVAVVGLKIVTAGVRLETPTVFGIVVAEW